MKKILTALLFVWTFAAHAQTLLRTMEGVTEYRLGNGLQVLLAPNDLQPRTYVNVVIKAGSAVEGFGEGGMAHLLEHLVFKGTPTTRDAMKAFTERSLSFNGTTSLDRTNYFASMNPDKETLHWYLGWQADAVTNSFISKADLDKEMTVVRNEFERAGSSSDGAVWEARMALAFPNHGYGRPTIGNRSDIENVSIERLQAFYKTWYRPDNMVLVVTGRFDVASTLAHIQTVFGILKNPAHPIPNIYTREPVQDGVRESIIRRVGTEVATLIGWRGAPRAHRDDAVLDVIAHSLANEGGGRFKTEIEKLAMGTQVSVSHPSMLQYGAFNASLRVKDATKLDEVQALLLKHIAAIAQSGVTAEELQQAQNIAVTSYEESKRTAEGVGSSLAESAAGGDWRLGFWYQGNMRSVTIADTMRAAKAYLVEANRVRVSFIPEASPVRAPDTAAIDLQNYVAQSDVPPAATQLERFQPSMAEIAKRTLRFDLKGGAKVALLARPAAGDAIQGTLRLHWGRLETLRGWGYAPYFGGLLLKGTTTRSEAQIKAEIKRLQSQLSIHTGPSGMTVGFTTTQKNWHEFAKLLQDVVRHPAFDEAAFTVWQQEAIASATRALDSPQAKADNALRRSLFEPYAQDDPRYQPTQEENLARWQALKLADIRRFWAQFAGSSVAEFAASGALDADLVKTDVEKMLGDWQQPDGAAGYQRLARPLFNHPAALISIPTPDKPNALMSAAHHFAVQAWSRESSAMELANGIFGGSASSRLFTRVRKQEGLSYGVGSSIRFNEDDQTATFSLQGSFAPSNKAKFDAAIQELVEEVRAKGLSSLELFFAKRHAANLIKEGLENDAFIASELATILYRARLGEVRDAAWYEAKQAMLQSITIEEVDQAIRKLVASARLVKVYAGNF